jgi:proteasome accessory factor B
LGGSQTTDAIEPFGAELGSEVDTLADLYQAIVDRNFVMLTYRDRRRKVAPHGLGHRMGHWYLAAVEGGETKVYRVDRIEAVDIVEGDDAFARSPGVSVRQALAAHPWEAGSEARVSVVIRFDAEAAWWADRRLDPAVERRPTPDGGVEVTLQVAHLDAFIGWLLTFGAEAEVISPPEVREAVIDRVRGVA